MFNLRPLPRTLPAALRDITHRKVEVRLSALQDLALLAHEHRTEVGQALIQALSDPLPVVRARAAVALADAGIAAAVAQLLPLLDDVDVQVREMALSALGELCSADDEPALRAIRAALEDELPALRFQALIAYARVAQGRALPALLAAFDDSDARVRYVALRTAEERMTDGCDADLHAQLMTRARQALDDDARDVRLAAAILLAKTKDEAALAELAAVVNSTRPPREPEDEQTAVDLAGELGIEAAAPGLMRRAFGVMRRDRFAWQARVALARLGNERARRSILKDLSAWSYEVRNMAVAAAGRARIAEARPLLLELKGRPERADPDAVQDALALLA